MSTPLQPLNCPNCAAPLPANSPQACPYCNTAFHQPGPAPPPTSDTARLTAELAISRLQSEIAQLQPQIDAIESRHSSTLGYGCLGLLLAIAGLALAISASTDPALIAPGLLLAAFGAWYALKLRRALNQDPAAPLKSKLAQLQAELAQHRQSVRHSTFE